MSKYICALFWFWREFHRFNTHVNINKLCMSSVYICYMPNVKQCTVTKTTFLMYHHFSQVITIKSVLRKKKTLHILIKSAIPCNSSNLPFQRFLSGWWDVFWCISDWLFTCMVKIHLFLSSLWRDTDFNKNL